MTTPRRQDVTTVELVGGVEPLEFELHDYADAKTDVIVAIKERARAVHKAQEE